VTGRFRAKTFAPVEMDGLTTARVRWLGSEGHVLLVAAQRVCYQAHIIHSVSLSLTRSPTRSLTSLTNHSPTHATTTSLSSTLRCAAPEHDARSTVPRNSDHFGFDDEDEDDDDNDEVAEGYAGWDDDSGLGSTPSTKGTQGKHSVGGGLEEGDDAIPYATVTPEEVHDRIRRTAMLASTLGWTPRAHSSSPQHPTAADPHKDQQHHRHHHRNRSDEDPRHRNNKAVDEDEGSEKLVVTDAAGRPLDVDPMGVPVTGSTSTPKSKSMSRLLSLGHTRRKATPSASPDIRLNTGSSDSKGDNSFMHDHRDFHHDHDHRSSLDSVSPLSSAPASPTSPPHTSSTHRKTRAGKEHRHADRRTSLVHVEVDMVSDSTSPYNTWSISALAQHTESTGGSTCAALHDGQQHDTSSKSSAPVVIRRSPESLGTWAPTHVDAHEVHDDDDDGVSGSGSGVRMETMLSPWQQQRQQSQASRDNDDRRSVVTETSSVSPSAPGTGARVLFGASKTPGQVMTVTTDHAATDHATTGHATTGHAATGHAATVTTGDGESADRLSASEAEEHEEDADGVVLGGVRSALDSERGIALLARLYVQRRDAFLSGSYPCVRATAVKLAAYQLAIECGPTAPQGRLDLRSVLPLHWACERGLDREVLSVKARLSQVNCICACATLFV
jgi:hypothetical protein